jgi:hypothetical protein
MQGILSKDFRGSKVPNESLPKLRFLSASSGKRKSLSVGGLLNNPLKSIESTYLKVSPLLPRESLRVVKTNPRYLGATKAIQSS